MTALPAPSLNTSPPPSISHTCLRVDLVDYDEVTICGHRVCLRQER